MKRSTPFIVTTAAAAAMLAWQPPAVSSPSDTAAEASTESSDMPEPRPVFIEAELPLGYPQPGPAYQVMLKQYPAYRAARADGGNAFRKLFNHIQKHDIAMTAPVEMTLDAPQEEDPGVARMDMLFMYADPDMGEIGPDVDVEVIDLPPVQVLTLGFFGNANRSQVNDALAMLARHLEADPDWVAAGPPRLLGYNSPMVPARNRYSEVQIPVKPAEEAVEESSASDPQDASAQTESDASEAR
ncbi:MAG: heme-binding protein [Planctomycetota bacterium]